MTKTQKIIVAILSVFALGLLIGVGYEANRHINLGQAARSAHSMPTSPYTPIPLSLQLGPHRPIGCRPLLLEAKR